MAYLTVTLRPVVQPCLHLIRLAGGAPDASRLRRAARRAVSTVKAAGRTRSLMFPARITYTN